MLKYFWSAYVVFFCFFVCSISSWFISCRKIVRVLYRYSFYSKRCQYKHTVRCGLRLQFPSRPLGGNVEAPVRPLAAVRTRRKRCEHLEAKRSTSFSAAELEDKNMAEQTESVKGRWRVGEAGHGEQSPGVGERGASVRTRYRRGEVEDVVAHPEPER